MALTEGEEIPNCHKKREEMRGYCIEILKKKETFQKEIERKIEKVKGKTENIRNIRKFFYFLYVPIKLFKYLMPTRNWKKVYLYHIVSLGTILKIF